MGPGEKPSESFDPDKLWRSIDHPEDEQMDPRIEEIRALPIEEVNEELEQHGIDPQGLIESIKGMIDDTDLDSDNDDEDSSG